MNEEMKRELDKIVYDIVHAKGWAGDDRPKTMTGSSQEKSLTNNLKKNHPGDEGL